MSGRFNGLTGIITGAGSGIGKATVERFVNEGGTGIAVDISGSRLEALRSEFLARNQAIKTVAGDLIEEKTVEEIVKIAGPHIDILINNAGIMDDFVPLDELDDA
ncbi:MAG: hypothetical protein RLZZ19_551, partial [Actinomycetota bacterium]